MTEKATQGVRSGLPDDPDDFTAVTEIIMVAHLAETAFSRSLPPCLTYAQFGVLNRLARLDGTETISQLAKAFLVSQPTMSSTVARLEAAGLVERRTDVSDARRRPIALTEAGRMVRDEGVERIDGLRDRIAPMLGDTDFGMLIPALRRLREALEPVVLE